MKTRRGGVSQKKKKEDCVLVIPMTLGRFRIDWQGGVKPSSLPAMTTKQTMGSESEEEALLLPG